MTALDSAAIARIKAAIEGKPVGTGSLVEVLAEDVLLVGALAKTHDENSTATVNGALGAKGHKGHGADGVKIWKDADQLRHLLGLVG